MCVITVEECSIGDIVEIRECQQLSRHKHYTLHRIIKKHDSIPRAAEEYSKRVETAKANLAKTGVMLPNASTILARERTAAEMKRQSDAARAQPTYRERFIPRAQFLDVNEQQDIENATMRERVQRETAQRQQANAEKAQLNSNSTTTDSQNNTTSSTDTHSTPSS